MAGRGENSKGRKSESPRPDGRSRPSGGGGGGASDRARSRTQGRHGSSPGRRGSEHRPGSTPAGKGERRIPPPPAKRGNRGAGRGRDGELPDRAEWESSEVAVERVVDGPGPARSGGGKRRPRERRSTVSVEGVDMGDVAPDTATKLQQRLADAARAFEAERFTEAERLLTSIRRMSPDVPEVHELLGLTMYRLGRWQRAITALERFYALTRSVEQHPVLADCFRALRRWDEVERLWDELGQASPSAELIEEGRIVAAGALADRGRLADAIRFLERAPEVKGKPKVHHLRRWYATADLYDRAGDTARARRLFNQIAHADPQFGDAAERASNL